MMLIIKLIIYAFIFLSSTLIGFLISKKYINRVNELQEFKNALNIFKTKIRYTYEPLPEIFNNIAERTENNVGNVFKIAVEKMKEISAGKAWEESIDESILNVNLEDINILKNLSKLLGETDLEGQISQIDITLEFLDQQINKAEIKRNSNEKMYRTLGMIVGIGIVIILI